MSTACPKVRDACESCHKRKIRCLLDPGSTACRSCSVTGTSCLFAPRAKAGRPRRTASLNQQRQKLTWAQVKEKNTTGQSHAGHNRSLSDSVSMVTADELHFGTVITFDNYWDSEKMTASDGMRSPGFLRNTQEAGQEDRQTQVKVNEVISPQDLSKQNAILSMITPSQSSTPPSVPPFMKSDESLVFDATLQLCGDLDRSWRNLRDGQGSLQEVESTLRMVEYACTTARTIGLWPPSEKASTALILVAIYKVFDISETLVRQSMNDSSTQDAIDSLFQLKRIDLALLQAYMFLSHTGQVDAVKKASEIHTWIDSIFRQQRYQMIW
jgi:hypothetical protein